MTWTAHLLITHLLAVWSEEFKTQHMILNELFPSHCKLTFGLFINSHIAKLSAIVSHVFLRQLAECGMTSMVIRHRTSYWIKFQKWGLIAIIKWIEILIKILLLVLKAFCHFKQSFVLCPYIVVCYTMGPEETKFVGCNKTIQTVQLK